MIRPAAFGFNAETAANNYFQHEPVQGMTVHEKALAEFDNMVLKLRSEEVDVIVVEDSPNPVKPDAIFPNNWLATSPDGTVAVFPMFAPNRRTEKRDDILQQLARDFQVNAVQDWSEFEAEGRFLEGTGSMVIDHDQKLIYAAISERTHIAVLEKFAATNNYQAVAFLATDLHGRPVYHTNVVMALGSGYCVLCADAIGEELERIAVQQLLESTGKTIVTITLEQMHAFAGNMLEVQNRSGEKLLLMSETARRSLRKDQVEVLEQHARLVSFDVSTIERVEGGSVRCMMAEIFLHPKK